MRIQLIVPILALLLGSCMPVAEEPSLPDSEAGTLHLEGSQIRANMRKMASMIFNLEYLISEAPASSMEANQLAVVEQLDELEKVTIKLGSGPRRVDHYLIDSRIDRLVEEISLARNAAGGAPPNYAPALEVIDQCKGCHLMR